MKHIRIVLWLLIATLASPVVAKSKLMVQPVADNVYAIVGDLTQRSPENLGNNATFGLVVTPEGAVLIDPGGSYAGAKVLHEAVKSVTDQPVKYVINTGGQDHRWLGNGYWKEQGASVIASQDAVDDQHERGSMQLTFLSNLVGDELMATTDPVYADVVFDNEYTLSLGGTKLLIRHLNGAHTPGNSFVWHADSSTVFTGDMVYLERILGVNSVSNTLAWLETYDAMAAYNAAHVVPGHGAAADMAAAKRDTYDYLVNLRTKVAAYMEAGGDMNGAASVDQSDFAYLANFDGLAKRNALAAFSQMEWE